MGPCLLKGRDLMAIAQLLASNHDNDHWFPFFPLIPLFFIGLWVVVFATFGRRWRHQSRRSGESVLAERYARGEIDAQEYRERRTALRSKD
jgi:putative membrane protein